MNHPPLGFIPGISPVLDMYNEPQLHRTQSISTSVIIHVEVNTCKYYLFLVKLGMGSLLVLPHDILYIYIYYSWTILVCDQCGPIQCTGRPWSTVPLRLQSNDCDLFHGRIRKGLCGLTAATFWIHDRRRDESPKRPMQKKNKCIIIYI